MSTTTTVSNYRSEPHGLVLPSAFLVIKRKVITNISKFHEAHMSLGPMGLMENMTNENFTPGTLINFEVDVYATEASYTENKEKLHSRQFNNFFAGAEPSTATINDFLADAVL